MQHDRSKIEEFKQMYNLVDTVGNDIPGNTGAALEAYANYCAALLQSTIDRDASSSQHVDEAGCIECESVEKNPDCWYCCPLSSDHTEE